ncbi:hypothetical protein [Ekhidna sp.]|uniref:hypothetical protein n=1 Tax=Ekhidna sp. TaxID=2608089 RepID=UPI003298573B
MQRFKLIFHIMYVVIALVIMYFSVDILLNTEQYLSKIKLSSYIKFPRYVMGLFLFLSILMVIEFTMQQLKIRSIKGGIDDLKDEIVELKAKLYDKSQEEPEPEMDVEEDDEEIADDDDK